MARVNEPDFLGILYLYVYITLWGLGRFALVIFLSRDLRIFMFVKEFRSKFNKGIGII